MEISKEQKEAIEYLEKYTKWETYGERNLEKDIITVLELLRDLYNDNIRYEKELKESEEDTMENKYANTLLESIDNIKFGLKYYIERCLELENELKVYRKMYENRVNEYIKLLKENEKKDELIEKMRKYLLKENKMCDYLESED